MPGVEAERTEDQITLLAYVQDKNMGSWSAHGNVHELERRALELAVQRVDQAMAALQVLLDEKITGGREILDTYKAVHLDMHVQEGIANRTRSDEWRTAHHREHELIQLAVDKASESMQVRLESMNEFRAQLNSMVATLVTLDVLDVRLNAMTNLNAKQDETTDKRISVLERARANMDGRMWAIGATVVVLEFALRYIHF